VAATKATAILRKAGVEHRLMEYDYRSHDAAAWAAEALGIEPERMFKSLVAAAGDQHVFALLPATAELSLKRLAAAAGAKHAAMAAPKDAERLTGYQIGGISPLGARRPLPVHLDRSAEAFELTCLNAGGRGLIVELPTADLIRLTSATLAELRAD
jgi:Cys-tRNA(Pro)/Cys-tRNA(Cys) deacylase